MSKNNTKGALRAMNLVRSAKLGKILLTIMLDMGSSTPSEKISVFQG
jgi:hypothetical protein